MTQILNIFRKDIRYLRLELLTSLAVLLIFVLAEARSWTEGFNAFRAVYIASNFIMIVMTSNITIVLLCASWGILIFRLIHAERLAGHNQFWTTRPYEWPKLLAAKSLFVMIFLYAPMLLAQIYLLHRGGFPVAPELAKLLLNLLLLTSTFILPIACVAAVTASFAQATLSLLGIGVATSGIMLGFSYLGSVSAGLGLPRRSPLFLTALLVAIALAFFCAVLLLQYGRRATRKSIVLLAAAAVLLVVTPLILRGSSAAAVGYAATVVDPPASVSIDADASRTIALQLPKNPRTAVYRIPLIFSNFAPGVSINREAERYTFTAADGYTWTSGWIEDRSDFGGLAPKGSSTVAPTRSFIDIPWRVHDRLAGAPVSIHMDFLVSQLQSGTPYTYNLATEEHPVPGVGVCTLHEAEDRSSVTCRVTSADVFHVTVSTWGSDGPCERSPQAPESGFFIGRARSSFSPIPFFSPIVVDEIHFWHARTGNDPSPLGQPCRGAPITFVAKMFQRRLRLETPSATIVLKD